MGCACARSFAARLTHSTNAKVAPQDEGGTEYKYKPHPEERFHDFQDHETALRRRAHRGTQTNGAIL